MELGFDLCPEKVVMTKGRHDETWAPSDNNVPQVPMRILTRRPPKITQLKHNTDVVIFRSASQDGQGM